VSRTPEPSTEWRKRSPLAVGLWKSKAMWSLPRSLRRPRRLRRGIFTRSSHVGVLESPRPLPAVPHAGASPSSGGIPGHWLGRRPPDLRLGSRLRSVTIGEMVGRGLLVAALCVLISSAGSAGAASPGVRACGSPVQTGALPVWARAGFHPPTQRIPHVLGRSRAIVAILWANPLEAPPPVDHNNKILWVSRHPVNSITNLQISAQRIRGGRLLGKPVQRRVKGGPGPSIINLPSVGCWRLQLHWAGRKDSLDLRYSPRR